VRSTALNAIQLSEDPKSVLNLVVPRLELVKPALPGSDGWGYDQTSMGHLIARLTAAARIQELRRDGIRYPQLSRKLAELTEDGTLSPIGALQAHRITTEAIARSLQPRRVLDHARQYLDPMYKTGPWVDDRMTTLLTRLQAATDLREVELADPAEERLAQRIVELTWNGKLSRSAATRIHRDAIDAIATSDRPGEVLTVARRYLEPLKKSYWERASTLIGQLEAAVKVRELELAGASDR
jgi:hypothetical protein